MFENLSARVRTELGPVFERSKQGLSNMIFARATGSRLLFIPPGDRKFMRKVGDGSSSSVVTAPLLWIGRNFPEAPPALWRKMADSGEEERVSGEGEQGGDHIMLELLERPTPFYSGALLWQATVMDYHLSGNGYWIKIRDRGGRPYEIWWTPSSIIKPVGDEKKFIKYYEYRPGTESFEIPPEDVVHFRYAMDPEDPRKGRSPLSALLHEVFTDTEAADFTATLLGNMGVPGLVVSPKGDAQPTKDDVDATKAYLKESFSGRRRGEPLVMSGPTSVSQFGFSPKDMSLREIRRIPEERVSAALGVPAIVAGLGAGLDRSTFANYAEAREAAYQDNIIPAQRLLAEEVRFQLLQDFEPDNFRQFRFGFDLSNVRVLQEDRNALANRFDVGIRGGWIRVAEGRRAMDLEVDDTDEIYLRPTTVIEVTAGEATPAPVPSLFSPGEGPAPALPPGEQQPPPEQPQLPAGQSSRGRKRRVTRAQSRLVAELTRDRYVLSTAFSSELESSFIAFGIACAETYTHMVGKSGHSNGNSKVNKQLDAETLARLIAASLFSSFDEVLRKQFEKHISRTLEKTVSTINSMFNLTGGVSDETQRRILETGGKRRGLLDIQKATQESLFRTINEGNQLGLGPVEMARNIRSEVPAGRFVNAGPSYRAQLISRTETNWAQNTSSIAFYRDADAVERVVAMDGGDDPECAERDGQEFTFDEAEIEMEKEHPNGTLAFAPIVSEGATV